MKINIERVWRTLFSVWALWIVFGGMAALGAMGLSLYILYRLAVLLT